jgi:hypothetical protein
MWLIGFILILTKFDGIFDGIWSDFDGIWLDFNGTS